MATGLRMEGRPESGGGAVRRVYGWMELCRIILGLEHFLPHCSSSYVDLPQSCFDFRCVFTAIAPRFTIAFVRFACLPYLVIFMLPLLICCLF